MKKAIINDNVLRIQMGIKSMSGRQRKNAIIVDLAWAVKEIIKLRKQIKELNEIRKH